MKTDTLRQSGRARRPVCMDLRVQGAGDDRRRQRGMPSGEGLELLVPLSHSVQTHPLLPASCLLLAASPPHLHARQWNTQQVVVWVGLLQGEDLAGG